MLNIDICGSQICQYLDLHKGTLRKIRGSSSAAKKKVVVYYYLYYICGYSSTEVGEWCNKSHSTVIKQIEKYAEHLISVKRELLDLYNSNNNQSSVSNFVMM